MTTFNFSLLLLFLEDKVSRLLLANLLLRLVKQKPTYEKWVIMWACVQISSRLNHVSPGLQTL